MHKYQPRIHLIMRRDPNTANLPITDLDSENYRTFVFPETVFTAVTGKLVRLRPLFNWFDRRLRESFLTFRTHQTNGAILFCL